MAFGIRHERATSVIDRAAIPDAMQNILQRPALGNMIERIGDRQHGGACAGRYLREHIKLAAVVVAEPSGGGEPDVTRKGAGEIAERFTDFEISRTFMKNSA